jgi:hypothetical protein
MSILGKLVGVECSECRRKGHSCQAQLIDDEPLCLRCANDEPCYFVTAQEMATPQRYEDDRSDRCLVPQLAERSVTPRKHTMIVTRPKFTGREVYEIRMQLQGRSVEQVAKLRGLDAWMIEEIAADPNYNGNSAVGTASPDEMSNGDERECLARKARKKRSSAPKSGAIKPEASVVMASLATYFGVGVEELCRVGRGRRPEARRRAVAMHVVQVLAGISGKRVAEVFGVAACQVSMSKYIVKRERKVIREAAEVLRRMRVLV